MKPLILTVQAFGPYAAEQAFDFAELKGRSFFLIHGPTGAGKTSILDAMCFALYGQTSGSLRNPKQMRSDHADLTTPTKVTFEFTIGDDRYRVERSPEQERPKKRGGTGTVTQEPEATLWPQTNAPEPLPPVVGWQKVNEAVERLMGFQVDQFRQVVMLPQGQFQRLLVAKSDERQVILENLFEVKVFGRIEAALKEASKSAERQIEDARRSQEEILRTAEAATADELAGHRAATDADLAKVRGEIGALRAAKAKAHERLSVARQVVDKLHELGEARAAARALEARQEAVVVQERAQAGAVRAAALADAEALLHDRRTAAAEAARRLAAAKGDADRAAAGKAKGDAALAAEVTREPKRDAARQDADRLAALEGRVLQLADARAKVRTAAEGLGKRRVERDRAEASLAAARSQITTAEQQAKRLELTSAQLASFQAAAREAELAMKSRARLEEARVEFGKAEAASAKAAQKLGSFREQLDAAKQILKGLETAWQHGQAAILAQRLADGAPCPVCGSPHHPSPARSGDALPSEASLNKHRQSVEAMDVSLAELTRDAADAARAAAEGAATMRAFEQTLGDRAAVPLHELEQAAQRAQADLLRSEQAGIELTGAGRHLEQLRAQETLAAVNLAGAQAARDEAEREWGAAQAVAAEREAGIPPHLQDAKALANALGAARRTVRAMAEAFEAAREAAKAADVAAAQAGATLAAAGEAARASGEAAEAQAALFARRLADAGFDDDAAFRAAKLPAARIDALGREVAQYRIDLQSARARRDRAAAAAEGFTAPDLAALESATSTADAALEINVRREAALDQRLHHADDALARLQRIDADLKALDARYRVVGQIAEVASGRNNYRMTFQRYVLGVFLDEVLQAASQRLRVMSRGRFLLQRVKDPVTGRSAGGLDLEVEDTWTGTTRPVSTLSGGEGFLASLSLALGLADVVQAYAGGIRLETIFVDEGFGSLDPEALDLAIRALQDLQHGGRLVGIISHVAELKEWIDARLEVQPGRRGSTARFDVP